MDDYPKRDAQFPAISAASKKAAVILVRHAAEHLGNTYRWLSENDDLRARLDVLAPPGSPQQNEAYWLTKWADPTRRDYAIICEGQHVGNCGLVDIDLPRRKAELWIYVGERRGNGIGAAAVARLVDCAFRHLQLEKVYLKVLATNPEGHRFYQRLGFDDEGLSRGHTRQNGRIIDAFWMALFR